MNLHTISGKITERLIKEAIIPKSTWDIYQYGIELMLSCSLTTIFILILSCIIDSFGMGLLYFLIFMPLKTTAGGYHASTYSRCFAASTLGYLIQTAAAKFLTHWNLPYLFWLAVLYVSAVYILKNAPAKNANHPVGETVLRKNRRLTVGLLSCECLAVTILYLFFQWSYLLNYVVLTITSIAVFLYPAVRKEGRAL